MSKPKSVFISIDMEGISGIVDGSQCGGQTGEYQAGRKLMVGDLNAAIEGALEAGATEIVVSDAHGGKKNIIPELVHRDAHLIRGHPKPWSMMTGIGESYDAAFYIGYHAMKGTENGVLAHTISGGSVAGIWINGREVGEFGINAALSGSFDVPSVLVSGDAALAAEAKALVPGIHAAIVKWGTGRKSAKCLHPERARELIKQRAKEALLGAESIVPYQVTAPCEFQLRFTNSGGGDACFDLPYIERVDGRTVKATLGDYHTMYRALRAAINVGGSGVR